MLPSKKRTVALWGTKRHKHYSMSVSNLSLISSPGTGNTGATQKIMRSGTNKNKRDYQKYGHHEYSDVFGVGVGSLRVRPCRKPSEGKCVVCGVYDERLYDGICPFCMSMINDREVGEAW